MKNCLLNKIKSTGLFSLCFFVAKKTACPKSQSAKNFLLSVLIAIFDTNLHSKVQSKI